MARHVSAGHFSWKGLDGHWPGTAGQDLKTSVKQEFLAEERRAVLRLEFPGKGDSWELVVAGEE